MQARILIAALLLTGAAGQMRADDKPIDRTEVDRRVVTTVYETAVLGTKIFNDDKNYEGCYRLYQGTLMAVLPMLDHRPNLQTKIKQRLERAAKMKPSDAAFELRAALDEIQREIAPGKDDPPKKTTLWERLGGEKGVRDYVHTVVLIAIDDPKVNFTRGKKPDPKTLPHIEQKLVEWISSKTGGPLKYEGKSMLDAHKGLGITDAEFDALKAIMIGQLKKAKVADADIADIEKAIEDTRKDTVEKKD